MTEESNNDLITRIIATCERGDDGQPRGVPHGEKNRRELMQIAKATADLLDAEAGAHVAGEFVAVTEDADIAMTPLFLARLLRAARGESVQLGHVQHVRACEVTA